MAANPQSIASAVSENVAENGPDPIRMSDEGINISPGKMGRLRKQPIQFISTLTSNSSQFYNGVGWRAYNDYTGAKLFDPDMTVKLKNKVLSSKRVTEVIRSMVGSSKDKGKDEELKKKARKIIDGLAANQSKTTIRFGAFLMNQLFLRLYQQGIHIVKSQFLQVKEIALKAEKEKISIFFAPCHRSHVDYMVLSYLYFRMGISLPFIAAGDNLNMPIIGPLMSQCGAFFHRRSFADDPLYTAIFKEYIELILENGYNTEAFIEGTRSRTGKLMNPKFGVIKIMVEAVLSGRVKDLYICPISIGYDKVLETESYVNELMGAEKKKESLSGLLNSAHILQLNLGRIDVRFAKPFSLREFVQEQIARRSGFDPYGNKEMQLTLLRSLGFRILTDINDCALIMPSALVGTVLLTLRGRGISLLELVNKIDWLRREIVDHGGAVADFGQETTLQVAERSIQTLGDLVGMRTELLETVLYANKRYELSFYRNQVIHLFLDEAIVCTAMYACFKINHDLNAFGRRGGLVQTDKVVPKKEVLEASRFLSSLLKSEFIFNPAPLEQNVQQAIARLVSKNVLAETSDTVRIAADEFMNGRENFDFFCFLLWPFVETYWLGAVSLFTIPEGHVLNEPTFNKRSQKLGLSLYYEGDLSYMEAINKETLKNAIVRLQEMGVVTRKRQEKIETFQVCEEYEKDKRAPLRRLIEEIGRFRREGKNRRDNANTGERTLRLATLATFETKL